MISNLQKMQRGLLGLLGSNQLKQKIRDQVLNGCQGVTEFEMALYGPAPTCEGVVAKIRNTLYTEEQSSNNQFNSILPNQSSGIE